MRKFFLLLLLNAFALYGAATATSMSGDSLEVLLDEAKKHYNNADYELAISQLEKAIQFLQPLNKSDLVEAYNYLAFSYVAFGDKVNAKAQFKKVLALEPELELDPATISPKIIKVFEETKAETVKLKPVKSASRVKELPIAETVKVNKPATVPPALVLSPAPQQPAPIPVMSLSTRSRVGALGRSCLFPGWGQRYMGKMNKGNKLSTSAGITLGTAFVTKVFEMPALSGLFGLAFLGIYIYNVGDIVFDEDREPLSMMYPDKDPCQKSAGTSVYISYTLEF